MSASTPAICEHCGRPLVDFGAHGEVCLACAESEGEIGPELETCTRCGWVAEPCLGWSFKDGKALCPPCQDEPPPEPYMMRRGAGRAACELTLQMTIGFASARACRLAARVDRMHELSENIIPTAEDIAPDHVVRELERELHTVAVDVLLLTSQRDEVGALRPFASWVTGA